MNTIEFSCNEEYHSLKEDFPTPVKTIIPEWYKTLKHSHDNRTIKGCMPFLETLTTGYLLKIPTDYKISHGIDLNDKGEPVTKVTTAVDSAQRRNIFLSHGVNIVCHEPHSTKQLKGAPFIEKNGNLAFHKISNPWKIKTPPGYSCLFLNPLNNPQQDYFEIIPGIVHTDKYINNEINFPIIINAAKYKKLELTIHKGTPYVQVIPFKRDDWEMKTVPYKTGMIKGEALFLTFLNRYKNKFWKKDRTIWK